VLFVLQNLPPLGNQAQEPAQPAARPPLEESVDAQVTDETIAAKFDLALFMQERGGRLHGSLNYRLDLFEASTIATLTERWVVLLQNIVKQPDLSIDGLDFFTPTERMQQEQEEQAMRQELPGQTGEWFDLSGIDFI
jgi:non-ribosomal peptide synthetase component F